MHAPVRRLWGDRPVDHAAGEHSGTPPRTAPARRHAHGCGSGGAGVVDAASAAREGRAGEAGVLRGFCSVYVPMHARC